VTPTKSESQKLLVTYRNNNNNNNQDDIYGAVIMTKPLREFTQFI